MYQSNSTIGAYKIQMCIYMTKESRSKTTSVSKNIPTTARFPFELQSAVQIVEFDIEEINSILGPRKLMRGSNSHGSLRFTE